MTRPRLLDLFCGAGGAAAGYDRAGFEVIGVDVNPQPHYPFKFIQDEAILYMAALLRDLEVFPYDAIHASPPCQAYTRKDANWGRKRVNVIEHEELIAPTRHALQSAEVPYVIENVPGAPLDAQLMLCGTMFPAPGESGEVLIKHRYFEANWPLPMPPAMCNHERPLYNPWSGKGRGAERHRDAQGTPWIPTSGGASRAAGYTGDLNNAIPPSYTEHIGKALIEYLALERAA